MCLEENHNPDGNPEGISRGRFLRLGGAGVAGAFLLGPVAPALARADQSPPPEVVEAVSKAAKESGVPEELLLAMGYVNTLWEMPPPSASHYEKGDLHGRGEYGFMQLAQNPSSDTLDRAASLTGLSGEDLKNDLAANVQGGAAVLSDLAGEDGPGGLDGWQEVVSEYGGGDLYANEVYERLQDGASLKTTEGENVSLEASPEVEVPRVYETAGKNTDYPRAVWRPAYGGNYTRSSRERSYKINRVVIHVAQGSYSGTISWFKDSRSEVSAHYVVGRGGQMAQCVRHKDIAYHAGNWNYNLHTIGIEHAGYGNNPNMWTKKNYTASARITAYICRRHKIPVNRKHIIGHRNVPGGTRTCPGPYFNFKRYLNLVRRFR